MIRNLLVISGVVLSLSSLSGCYYSFYSSQYNLTRATIDRLNNKESQPNWILKWNEYSWDVTPVSVESETWFVGPNDILVRFDGWQVRSIQNLLLWEPNTQITIAGSTMRFFDEERLTFQAECDLWNRQIAEEGLGSSLIQKCVLQDSNFINEIMLDDTGKIIYLEYFFTTVTRL